MPDFSIEIIKNQRDLTGFIGLFDSLSIVALDIETVNWWNRHQERVALIQIAYRHHKQPKVVIIDALANLDIEPLRVPLEMNTTIKVIHNAVFDATRLADHYKFKVAPIFDTMVAARRSGEERYSLKAQAEKHLALRLDKSGQRSDWSRRPQDTGQVYYAALDAFAALLLYENQTRRKLNGTFQIIEKLSSRQAGLPLTDSIEPQISSKNSDIKPSVNENDSHLKTKLSDISVALLGIIAELPTRYHPDGLAASVGNERIGLTDWIVDRILGADMDLDEESAKLGIADLYKRNLVRITATRRLAPTVEGELLWYQFK